MDLAQILETCPELEVSMWLPDLEVGGAGTAPAPFHPAPVPERGPDPVVRLEGGQEASSPPPATEPKAQEKPRRRRRVAQATPTEGSNGQGEKDLSELLLTLQEVGKLFRMHPGSVRRWIDEGRLAGVRLGRVLVPAEAVHQLIEARKLKPRQWARRKPANVRSGNQC